MLGKQPADVSILVENAELPFQLAHFSDGPRRYGGLLVGGPGSAAQQCELLGTALSASGGD